MITSNNALGFTLFSLVVFAYGNIRNASNVFLITWMALISGLAYPVVTTSRDVSPSTIYIILTLVFVSFVSFRVGLHSTTTAPLQVFSCKSKSAYIRASRYLMILAAALMASNVAFSSGLPLINLLTGIGPNYLDFGIPTINGLLIAYINSLACIFFVIYKRKRSNELLLYLSMFFLWHLLVLSRQNLLLLLVELFVLFLFESENKSHKIKIIVIFSLFITIFGFIGEFRSGSIVEASGVSDDARGLPTILVWLLLYTSVNIYSVDSVLQLAPAYSLHSIAGLVPSFIRPYFFASYVVSFDRWQDAAVVSYIPPLYSDFGLTGLFLFTILAFYLTGRVYNKATSSRLSYSYFIYPLLYFCALMSFFTNFWFYLPVIFQLIIFRLVWGYYFKRSTYDQSMGSRSV